MFQKHARLLSKPFPLASLLLTWILLHLNCMEHFAQEAQPDSAQFHQIRSRLEGCWEKDHYRFCYDSAQNFGHESKSRIRSSAPMFKLSIHNDQVCMEWTELTGGSTFLPILKIRKNKVVILGANKKRAAYRRS